MTPHEKTYSVYMHVNKENNKKYIGCTSQIPSIRWNNGRGYAYGQIKFYNAIKEFGWNNFDHIIIKTDLSKEDAFTLEMALIEQYNTVEDGYNAAYGGEKNKLSEASKEKLRKQRLGEKNPNYNPLKMHTYHRSRDKKIQEEEKKKYYTFSNKETSIDGRKSLEFKLKQKELKSGTNNPNFGKHAWSYGIKMTEKQKQKMYEAWTEERKEVIRQQKLGQKNPQAKKVIRIDDETIYNTIVEAAKMNNLSERTVSDCCNGKTKNPKIKFAFMKEGDLQ